MTYWFEATESVADVEVVVEALDGLEAETPAPLPERAVEAGAVADEDDYYDRLHDVTTARAERRIAEETGTPERDLVHAVRTLDAIDEATQTLETSADDWRAEAGARGEARLEALDERTAQLEALREEIEETVRETAHAVAPTLSAIAGPVLGARLVELAGGMEALARMPSGTVQVLGAEDALFRHLTDDTPPPKHGAIYLHPAVRGAPPDGRGRIARTLAGKLTIAARIDHYRGELDEDLVAEWQEKRAAMEAE